jgi:serine protease
MFPSKTVLICLVAFAGLLIVGPLARAQEQSPKGPVGGMRVIEDGQPPVAIHATADDMERFRQANPHAQPGSTQATTTSKELAYRGGAGGVGVETSPKLYLVFWGSQWTNNDPSGEAPILENFYTGVGGSSWANTVTQYCQGVASGTVNCNGSGTPAGDPSPIFAGYWYDNGSAAPSNPRQSQIATEAIRAAQHFLNASGSKNANAQYVIATSHGHNSSGFGSSYCAYHSSTSSADGNIAYTNLPYMTDAGANCGANFNGLGPTAGITIVSGHEMAETITDPFPNGGWLDGNGAEIGDKCAWISSGQGASANISVSTGTFAVQSLWSNAFNGSSGGCVQTYP